MKTDYGLGGVFALIFFGAFFFFGGGIGFLFLCIFIGDAAAFTSGWWGCGAACTFTVGNISVVHKVRRITLFIIFPSVISLFRSQRYITLLFLIKMALHSLT
nr:hypothetical protein [Providencia stuartii]